MSRSIFITRYKEKIVSIFSRQVPHLTSASQPNLFLKLPYDVRVIIYSYLDTEPPFSPRLNSLALYQSCHQIKDELDELASRKLHCLCSAVEHNPNINISCTITPSTFNPRHLTVMLPYSAFQSSYKPTEGVRGSRWDRSVLDALHPLFTLHIDVLRIHFSGANSYVPEHDTLRARLCVQNTMCNLLEKIGRLIDRQNQFPRWEYLGVLLSYNDLTEEEPRAWPSSPIRAKRICLSWDFRSTPSGPLVLVGREHAFAKYSKYYHLRSILPPRKSRDTHSLTSVSRKMAKGYYLHDMQHLVGEVGISSQSKWVLTEKIWLHNNTPTGNRQRGGALISSRGLGEGYARGLASVRKSEFERLEERVFEEQMRMWDERKFGDMG